ncbi:MULTISPECIES: aspartate aminotransferase family protein [Brevibacillus]|jgi:adenosylmethionine-8-amino-7-oxononanoate aminotransferase|uniref:aspartate aminotransferase family protein n=1 Tax=Brevibacillus TaxID=55080 RepID=UPI0004699A6F|nr:aspartate aminotransferase family protein [Brevibacillus borstelensis]KKX53833.1 aminotransferase [Brevibacillus borstelensis cifa_chp40]MBE5395017.1 aspartate aminotransferase family protein [Brevibacillus borstelensis]MCC0563757.1 aspartate aminotransferase family protein [Brevibacillus borstelensis]MCM3469544.1 aspartate aminotransferase family protein [Brevibacillus borstelensis]MCM3559239.1 aspartate aminotransferase family protein [Brevibacillus borstelensis]
MSQEQQTHTLEKESLLEKDRAHMWHHMSPYNPNPMIVTEASGSWVTDIDGNKYLDGMSGLWCVNIGYGRQELAEAAYEQLKTMAYFPLTQSHVPAIKLSEKVSEWLGEEYRVFFSNSGSEANEVAFKIARQYHHQNGEPGRYKFISRHRAYHGNTMGALAATGQSIRKQKYEPLAPGFLHVSPPYCYRCPFGKSYGSCSLECAQVFDEVINWEGANSVAAVIMEPTITGGGVIVPPPEYMPKVREICDKYGVLLIVDEVICGFGRSGQKFGHQNFGIKPDIVTMAKGITSAYLPLSATAVRADIADKFNEQGVNLHFRHVNTFGGNPAACALALKNLELMEEEQMIERAGRLGEELREKLSFLEEHPHVGDIRSFGFLMGIEMVENRETKEPAAPDKLTKVIGACKQRGLIIGRNGDTIPGFNNVLTLSPPFSTTSEDIDFIARVLREAFAELA